MYLNIEKELQWPNPIVSSASEKKAGASGESGVKMTGPYEYVPPVFWLADTQAGGAYGFNAETSPGPAIPARESLQKFIPKDHLWPMDDVWNYHAGGERFTTIDVFTDGLNRRYGPASSLDDYERKAQAMAYDGQRAMFEAYARNKYTSTGVIQWMLNNAWPSLIWHLYDYYLVPAGGYFGTKKACEPVHVQYSYHDNPVAVINGTYETPKGSKVSAKIFWPRVVAANQSDGVAFMVPPRLARGKGGDEVTPVFWSDNYFSLLPGEKKSVMVRFDSASLHGAMPELVVDGWNVESTTHEPESNSQATAFPIRRAPSDWTSRPSRKPRS